MKTGAVLLSTAATCCCHFDTCEGRHLHFNSTRSLSCAQLQPVAMFRVAHAAAAASRTVAMSARAARTSVIPRAQRVAAPIRAAPGACTRMYHDNIVDHYENPRNVGACVCGASPTATWCAWRPRGVVVGHTPSCGGCWLMGISYTHCCLQVRWTRTVTTLGLVSWARPRAVTSSSSRCGLRQLGLCAGRALRVLAGSCGAAQSLS